MWASLSNFRAPRSWDGGPSFGSIAPMDNNATHNPCCIIMNSECLWIMLRIRWPVAAPRPPSYLPVGIRSDIDIIEATKNDRRGQADQL